MHAARCLETTPPPMTRRSTRPRRGSRRPSVASLTVAGAVRPSRRGATDLERRRARPRRLADSRCSDGQSAPDRVVVTHATDDVKLPSTISLNDPKTGPPFCTICSCESCIIQGASVSAWRRLLWYL